MPELRVALCSDPLSAEASALWGKVSDWLRQAGWVTEGQARSSTLWRDVGWSLVADPTGGSSALSALQDLMGCVPADADARAGVRAWWTMSDNSLILNALLDRGLCRLIHGHPMTMAGREAPAQRERFALWSRAILEGLPFPERAIPPVVPLRSNWPVRSAVIGGNLSALERLATTPWRPRPKGRLLLVESLSCPPDQAGERLSKLLEDPHWIDIGGVVVGRFSRADREDPDWLLRLEPALPGGMPVARWPAVGHGSDGWSVPLGEEIDFKLVSRE